MEQAVQRKSLKGRNRNLNPLVLFLFSILVIYVAIFTFVLVWALMNSFKPLAQWDAGQYMQLPDYSNPLWTSKEMRYDMKGNEVISTYYPNIFANYTKVIEAMPGVGNARYYAGWKLNNPMTTEYQNTIFTMVLFVMVMPLVGTEPARVKLLQRLYLFDTMWGDFIVNFTFANMYFLVFYAFYSGVSGTYAEAAEVDGASQLRTMIQIIMPLASKMILTVVLIFFIGRWNNYATPLVYMPNKWMISYRLYIITIYQDKVGGDPAKIAGAMIIVLPILIIFILLRNKIMGNVSMGGIKE